MRSLARLLLPATLVLGTGCGIAPTVSSPIAHPAGLTGSIHGGQQPISNATIQLYAVGTTGDGSPAVALGSSTTTDANGNFSITGNYSCPVNNPLVYLLGTGGSPTLGSPANPQIALMAALGLCNSLSPSTFTLINEVTTVAAAYALAPFAVGPTSIGSSTSDATALANDFTLASQFANVAIGSSPGLNVPAGIVPVVQINTIANILAACINSLGGVSGDSSPCGMFFSLSLPASTTPPTDSFSALVNLAKNPALNTTALFNLPVANPPFQPSDTPPPPNFQVLPNLINPGTLQVGPQNLNFPATIVATPANPQTVVLSNSGATSITLSGISFLGANAGDFQQGNSCGSSLAAGAQCQISVSFTPQATGSRTAYLSISSSSNNSPQYVQVFGFGSASSSQPQATVSEPSVFVEEPGTSYDVTLSNTGSGLLTISGVTVSTPGNTVTTNCGATLAPAASCTASVHTLIPIEDQLTFSTNDPTLAPVPISPNETGFYISDLFFPPTAVANSSTENYSFPSGDSYVPAITGPNASDFAVSSNCTAAGQAATACTVTVTLTPSAGGLRTAQMNLGYGGALGAYVPLAGIGITSSPNPNLSLSASSLTFNDSLAPQSLTLSNYGTTAVNVQPLAIQSLLGPSEFSETDNCAGTLYGQSICTIIITSSRRVTGGTQSMLNISGDFGNLWVPLVNTANPPFDFGYVSVGNSVADFTLTASGSGSASISETIAGPNAGDFTPGSCSAVGTGAYCTATASFTPQAPGLRTATLTEIASSTSKYFVMGTGTNSTVRAVIGAQSVISSTVTLSGVVLTGTYTLRNAGTTALVLTTSVSGQSPANFIPATSCGTLLVGGSCTFTITYQSSQPGFSTANLDFTDSSSGQTFSEPVYLFSDEGPPISPNPLAFPSTQIGSISNPMSVTVATAYGDPITVTGFAPFIATKGSCVRGESPCILTFVFAPTVAGPASTRLSVNDSYLGGAVLTLSGTGIAPVIPGAASVSPSSLTFPLRPVSTVSVPQTVTLSNSGAGSFNITSIGLSGTNSSEFSYTTTCGSSVAPGGNCTFSVSFAPVTPGSKSAGITINGDSNAGLPITIGIVGSAQ